MTVEINTKFLNKMQPEKMIFWAVVIFFLLFIIAPVDPVYDFDLYTVSYLVGCLIAFVLGTKLINSPKIIDYKIVIYIDDTTLKRIYNITFILGLLGVTLRYVELVYIRGMSLENTAVENMMAAKEDSSILAIISAFFFYFSYIPVTLDYIFQKLHSRKIKIISLLLLLSSAFVTLFTAARFPIMTPLLYLFIAMLYTNRIKFSFKYVLLGIATFLIVLNIIGSLFLNRLDERGLSSIDILTGIGYADKVPATPEFVDFMSSEEDKIYYPQLFAYSNVVQYFVHAVFEFPAVMHYIDYKGEHTYGRTTLGVFAKPFDIIIGNNNAIDLDEHNLRPGIWSTFFFVWYLDFGWFGVVLMVFFGFVCKYIWWKTYYEGNIMFLPMLIYLSIILLFILQLNLIAGLGSYTIFSFGLLILFCRNKIILK